MPVLGGEVPAGSSGADGRGLDLGLRYTQKLTWTRVEWHPESDSEIHHRPSGFQESKLVLSIDVQQVLEEKI